MVEQRCLTVNPHFFDKNTAVLRGEKTLVDGKTIIPDRKTTFFGGKTAIFRW